MSLAIPGSFWSCICLEHVYTHIMVYVHAYALSMGICVHTLYARACILLKYMHAYKMSMCMHTLRHVHTPSLSM